MKNIQESELHELDEEKVMHIEQKTMQELRRATPDEIKTLSCDFEEPYVRLMVLRGTNAAQQKIIIDYVDDCFRELYYPLDPHGNPYYTRLHPPFFTKWRKRLSLGKSIDSELNEEELQLYVKQKIASFYSRGLLNVKYPVQLYWLLLALLVKRLLTFKGMSEYTRMVVDANPALKASSRKILNTLNNMNRKTKEKLTDYVRDQASMTRYIDLMYPKTKMANAENIVKKLSKMPTFY